MTLLRPTECVCNMQDVESLALDQPTSTRFRVLNADSRTFRESFGHIPFALRHKLASSGLFTIDRIAAALDKMVTTGAGRLFIYESAQTPGDVFSKMKRKNAREGLIPILTKGNYWVSGNLSEVDSELHEFCHGVVSDTEALLGMPIFKNISREHVNLFAASPHVITPYHIDREHNFLCQVIGEKDVWLWDPDERENLSESEIETFYCGEMEAARYKTDLQSRSREFHIRPGDAVYHPPLAPHWVKNGPELSISISIGFNTTALERRARIYQANRALRKFGFVAPPPGRSYILDGLRSGAISGIKQLTRSSQSVQRMIQCTKGRASGRQS